MLASAASIKSSSVLLEIDIVIVFSADLSIRLNAGCILTLGVLDQLGEVLFQLLSLTIDELLRFRHANVPIVTLVTIFLACLVINCQLLVIKAKEFADTDQLSFKTITRESI